MVSLRAFQEDLVHPHLYPLGPPRRFSLQHALILQPDEAPAPDHDVIQHVDTQQPTRLHGLLGQARVLREPLQ